MQLFAFFLKKVYLGLAQSGFDVHVCTSSGFSSLCPRNLNPANALPARGVPFWRFNVIISQDIMEIVMPNVGGKKFPYTAAGKKAAAAAMKKKKSKQYGTTTKRKMPARKK